MSEFRTRRIRQKPPLKPFKKIKSGFAHSVKACSCVNKKQKSYFLGSILVLLSVFIVLKVTMGIFNTIKDFDPKDVLYAIDADLKKDLNGYSNFILLGDGGHERDGADLIDTIMVASIDYEDGSVSLLSIPRDYYVRSEQFSSSKINELYRNNKRELGEEGAYDLYRQVAGDIVNLNIQYYARIDFNAFVEVIDSLGGITVDVKESIYDPYYPNETDNGYTVFEIKAGLQEMNGETALKFVRSRKNHIRF